MSLEFVKRDLDQLQILIKSSILFFEQSLEYAADLCGRKELSKDQANGYLAEILHSILFIGYINIPSIGPQQLLPENAVGSLMNSFPDVFEKYTSHLPLRTPYSILLDMVVQTTGDQAMDLPKNLLALNEKMHVPRNGRKSIMLPKAVYSAAFTMLNDQRDEDHEGNSDRIGCGSRQRYVQRRACEKCWGIFPEVVFLPPERDEERASWKHGNCAECEAMSNLLNGEVTVDEGVKLGEDLLSTAAANEKLKPLLKPRIDNLKSTLKNRIETAEFQFFLP
ncbi:hypothetical protein ANANG_G00293450 [Anguilla anguilla]|uniref:Uncharacterized protein n=1 Tax=Anguilla anguilla TaxID=7936 RepID=A0A9D3LKG1_ANGAN|nr:hypothetical protein ANANG_G00293450 [Anguilla anguilla]